MRTLRELARLEAAGGLVAVVTVIQTRGSTPGESGARMLVYPDGRTLGSIGGGCMENALKLQALESLREGKPRMTEHTLDDEVDESGMICGGTLRVYIEPIAFPRQATST
ncbi:MAG: XdhC family protein [Candidatus Riflebacteria bacterium]|nr:XdhC family protein [Candidatus Riflebacteria bacterium]